MKVDVCLYGHIFADTIYTKTGERRAWGGIANVARYLDKDLSVQLEPTSFCHSVIVDYKGKSGVTSYDEIRRIVPDHEATWMHFCYVDKAKEVPDTHCLRSDVVTTDSVDSPAQMDIDCNFGSGIDAIYHGCTQWKHDRIGGLLITDGHIYQHQTKPKMDIQVLGAGDMLVAACINYHFKCGYKSFQPSKRLVDFCHEQVEEWLYERDHIGSAGWSS